MSIDLSLIIPCYNEELILEASVKQVFEILNNTRFDYEIIFVDDHSKDNTKSVIENITRSYPDKKISAIFHAENKGRGRSVSDGIKIAKGDVTGFIDIDLEVHARYIPSCVLAVKEGFDIALGHRIYTFHFRSIMRHAMSRGYIFLVRRLFGIDLKDTETGFKFFDRKKILSVLEETREQGWFWDTEIMARAYLRGYKIKEIPSLYLRNFKKRSTVNGLSDTIYYLKKLLEFRKIIRKEDTRKTIEIYWQKTPHGFASAYRNEANGFVRKFLKDRLFYISGLMDVRKGMEAIDVGCGSGAITRLLLEKGAKVTAVDYSEEMLKVCSKGLEGLRREDYVLINCDANSLHVQDNKFDLLVSSGLLDYLSDTRGALQEFYRVLKPGGNIIFTVPKTPSLFSLLRTMPGNYIKRKIFYLPPIEVVLSKKDIIRLFSETGFILKGLKSFYTTMWIVSGEKTSNKI